MTPEPVEALVERVREALELVYREHFATADDALAALTELAERVKAAERLATENGRLAQTHWDRAEAAERERDGYADEINERTSDQALLLRKLREAEAQRDELVLGEAECDGSSACKATTHIEGCFASRQPPGWGADRKCPETCG